MRNLGSLALFMTTTLVAMEIGQVNAGMPRIYSETVVTDKVTDTTHWASYDYDIREKGNISKVSYDDDSQQLQPVDISMPFFNHDSLQMYVGSNGFLSPIPYSMCVHFCHNNDDDSNSYYKFNKNLKPNGGGDWPLVGLYVHDLDPTNTVTVENGGAIYIYKFSKEGQDVVGVEFRKIAQYSQQQSNPTDTTITCQAELWPNGTIIFRYDEVLTSFHTLDLHVPSVGLIYTHNSKVVSGLPRAKTSAASSGDGTKVTIKAIRYEPRPDPCLQYNASCGVCLANSECRWCSSTDQCLTLSNALDICRNGDMRGNATNCGFWPETQHNDTDASQAFYTTKLRHEHPWTSIEDNPAMFPNRHYWYNKTQGTYVPIVVNLPFNISFFYNPPVKDPHSDRVINSIWAYPQGYYSMMKTAQKCSFDKYYYCENGDFTMTLSAFAAATGFSRQVSRMVAVHLPANRNTTDPFCTTDLLNANGVCDEGYVIETDYAWASRLNGQVFTTQVLLVKGDGIVQLRYKESINASHVEFKFTSPDGSVSQLPASLNSPVTSLWATWPRPTSGLVRSGRDDDPSNLLVPWSNLEPGLIATILPTPGCVDCGKHGTCNYVSRMCDCDTNFMGDNCDVCVAGHYSIECFQCPSCKHGGSCDEGIKGSGVCLCNPPYSGKTCDVTCESKSAAICDPACYNHGGYCECGTCVCNTGRGWHGTDCSKWRDPCGAWNLDGCRICVASSDVQCNWCDSHHCFAQRGQWGLQTVNISSCSSYTSQADEYNCPVYRRMETQGSSFVLLVVVIAFVVLGISACVAVMIFCGCKRRSINILEAGALPGTPDFDPPRREREVIEVHVLPPNSERPVLGLPLKQIPLKELYAIQRGQKPAPEITDQNL